MKETAIYPNYLQRWLLRQAKRARQYISLHNIVFGRDMASYFLYRTRYLAAVTLLRSGLHIVEFGLLAMALPAVLLQAMLLRLLSSMIEGSWWGVTDSMRHRIRALRRLDDTNAIQKEMIAWLTLALLAGAAIILACGIAAYYLWHMSAPFAVLTIAVGLQTAVRVVSRTFFSGAYSIRRVFLPVEVIIGPEIIIMLTGLLLHEALGEWTVAVCVLLSTALAGFITYSYVRRVTDFLRITPRKIISFTLLAKAAKAHSLVKVMAGALASIGMRMHDLVLIVLLHLASPRDPFAQKLLFAIYLIMPLFRGSMSCSQVMYFDLSKYALDMFKGFRNRLECIGMVYSAALSCVFALLAVGLLALFTSGSFDAVAVTIFIYMVLSGLYGFVLVALFARRRYAAVVATTALQYMVLVELLYGNWAGVNAAQAMFAAILPSLLIGAAFLYQFWRPPVDQMGGYLQWAHTVLKYKAPACIGVLSTAPHVGKGTLKRIARALLDSNPEIVLAIRFNDILICMPRSHKAKLLSVRNLVRLGGGHIRKAGSYEGRSGREAYGVYFRAMQRAALSKEYIPETQKELESIFMHRFPEGIVQYPMQPNRRLLALTDTDERRAVLHDVKKATFFEKPGRQSKRWSVSAVFDKDTVSAFFLIPRAASSADERREWFRLIEHYNYRAFNLG